MHCVDFLLYSQRAYQQSCDLGSFFPGRQSLAWSYPAQTSWLFGQAEQLQTQHLPLHRRPVCINNYQAHMHSFGQNHNSVQNQKISMLNPRIHLGWNWNQVHVHVAIHWVLNRQVPAWHHKWHYLKLVMATVWNTKPRCQGLKTRSVMWINSDWLTLDSNFNPNERDYLYLCGFAHYMVLTTLVDKIGN